MGVKWMDGPLPWFTLVHYLIWIKAQGVQIRSYLVYSMLALEKETNFGAQEPHKKPKCGNS